MRPTIAIITHRFIKLFTASAVMAMLCNCASTPTPYNVWDAENGSTDDYYQKLANERFERERQNKERQKQRQLAQHRQQSAQNQHQGHAHAHQHQAVTEQDGCWVAEDGQLWCWVPEQPTQPRNKPQSRPAPSPKKNYLDRLPAGVQIDRSISVFQHARKAYGNGSRARSKRRAGWRTFLDSVDEACVKQPSTADMGAFIRARVTIEAELETDERHNRILDPKITARAKNSIAFVDSRVRELRMASLHLDTTFEPNPTNGKPLIMKAPLRNMRITSPFGPRKDPIDGRSRFHAGVDLGAPYGERIRSTAFGTVVFADRLGGHGLHVVVDHGNGYKSHYSHLERITVKPGQLVETGDVVGLVGSSGRSTGPHLHFAITNRYGSYLDPMKSLNTPLPDSRDEGFSFVGGPK